MSHYTPLTINKECSTLEEKMKVVSNLDEELKSRSKAQNDLVQQQRKKLLPPVADAIDDVLAACDVAKENVKLFCNDTTQCHADAKEEMVHVKGILDQLQAAWHDQTLALLKTYVGHIVQLEKTLTKYQEDLEKTGMSQQYKSETWRTDVSRAVKYVADRKSKFDQRVNDYHEVLADMTKTVAVKTRVSEYVARAHAMEKTAHVLQAQHQGEQKNFLKIRNEMFDFATSVERDVAKHIALIEKHTEAIKRNNMTKAMLEAFLKNVKGRAKTMRVELQQEAKKVPANSGNHFKPILTRAELAIKKLDDGIRIYQTEVGKV
jgi:hypothetical protein